MESQLSSANEEVGALRGLTEEKDKELQVSQQLHSQLCTPPTHTPTSPSPPLPPPPSPPTHTHTQTLRDCLHKVTEKVSTGEQEGADSNEETEGRREAQLARIQAMLDTTTVYSVLNTVISRKYGRWR